MVACDPSALIAEQCPEAYDGSVPGSPPLAGPLGLIPEATSVEVGRGSVELTASSRIIAVGEAAAVGEILGLDLRTSTGLPLPVSSTCGDGPDIVLRVDASVSVGLDGYELEVGCHRIEITAPTLGGLYYGTQTLRQLLPAETFADGPSGEVPAVSRARISDHARFIWRGFMLDVARHFFDVSEVKRLIDLAAHHKLNRFHLHLTDDQGWRIQIDSWPNLTTTGGSSEVGGGPGGYYTKADFAEIVDYAADRYVVIVPEIDMPGHTNAALASYPDELTPSGDPPRAWPYTGTEVGFSSLWVNGGSTNQFVADVLGEVAEMTPGPYLHIGGDEADTLDADDYADFIEGVEALVTSLDKTMVGWADISQASLSSSSIAQFWSPSSVDTLTDAVARGMGVIMSPADAAYLDMKYDDGTPVGHDWAGLTSVQEAYEWDPVTGNSPASSVVGVEAPPWTETVDSRADIDLLAFPRLSGIAEIGWSAAGRDFGEYAMRLSLHENRLTAWGVGFYQ